MRTFAIAPDGRSVFLAAGVAGKRQLWLRPRDVLQWQPMPNTEDAIYPFWSPDSRYIAFFAAGKLRKIAASGGPSQPLGNIVNGRGGTWNRDDRTLVARDPATQGSTQRVASRGWRVGGGTRPSAGVRPSPAASDGRVAPRGGVPSRSISPRIMSGSPRQAVPAP